MPYNIPGTIAIIVLVIIILVVIVSCINVVQQSKAYVVERLGAFHSVWGVGLHFKLPFIERVVKKISLKEQVADFDPSPSSPRITSPCRSIPSSTSRSPTPSCIPTVWSTP